MPLKHLEEVLITSWLFRSWVCQILPLEISQWQKQYSSWKVSLYFHFTSGMTKTLRRINTQTVQFVCHNWNCWPLKRWRKTWEFLKSYCYLPKLWNQEKRWWIMIKCCFNLDILMSYIVYILYGMRECVCMQLVFSVS